MLERVISPLSLITQYKKALFLESVGESNLITQI